MSEELLHPTAERTVAAAIALAGSEAMELLNVVAPSDFSSPQLQIIVEATKVLLLGIEPIDTTAIVTECRNIVKESKSKVTITEEYVRELIKTDIRRAPSYAHTVQRFAWLRKFRDTIAWANTELMSLPDPDELYTAAQARLEWLKPPTKENRFIYGWDTMDYSDVLKQRKAEADKGTTLRFDYPWDSWSDVRDLRPGMVGLLAGPEGSGKTGYLEMIAEHWATKAHVVFVHLENNIEYTKDRRMARHARISIEKLEEGRLDETEKRQVREAEQTMRGFTNNLHYLDAAGMPMSEIINELRTRQQEGICQAVVLDYLNKVRASRGQVKLFGDNMNNRRADDMEQFKSFCEQTRTVGFTAAQYNKEGKKTEGRKRSWNIRDSGEIVDKAQLVVLLEREVLEEDLIDKVTRKVIREKGEDSPDVMVRIDKQNRGRKFEFTQVYKGEHFTVGDKKHAVQTR